MKNHPLVSIAEPVGGPEWLPPSLVPISATARPATPQLIPDGIGDLLGVGEVAALLHVHVDTLARWRRRVRETGRPEGPPFVTVGRGVRYLKSDLVAYLASQGRRDEQP